MEDRLNGMILGSLVGDSLSLGAHGIYDTDRIKHEFGTIKDITAPPKDSFHKNKTAGEHTHYGDQTLFLLKNIYENAGFDSEHFKNNWLLFMNSYNGYIDSATEKTLENMNSNKNPSGSDSDDMAGASRIAPIMLYYYSNIEKVVEFSIQQTKTTHNNKLVVDISKFFAYMLFYVLRGDNPQAAIKKASDIFDREYIINQYVNMAFESCDDNSIDTIRRFGQECSAKGAFPSALHIIIKYHDDFEKALVQNVMSGGDSAARALIIGAVLGAYKGESAIPKRWLKEMKSYGDVITIIGSKASQPL
ncbi:ADP-ribosylglycohydrolase [Peptoclostridium litorale DSM 5388]|uniref:ADP-ribosylation/crystallin J1 n=1 Tax=Peptoclostridium litorale DSM 5388 TaxID=1121324 RepID=A0A069RFN0_PEPLI|nr:ADP-ribosylglycohydrolase family protein [Peptoclostridium litorale]KDR95583.1 ADP-ribosylation/crystallin J1 [Peptoclostridium litorale DSM 5388]SIN98785.1 ADP-ribosylglycohydrolase [Peptoclostridium litorale DSM 5388]